VTRDFPQHLGRRKCNGASDVGKSTVRGNERQAGTVGSQNAEDSYVHPILQVLLAQILRHRATLAHRSNVELLTRPVRKLSIRRERSDAPKYCLIWRFELHQQELTVHRNALEVIPIWQHQVGMKFQAALLESPEYSSDLIAGKKLELRHAPLLHPYRRCAGSASCS
jgi:hypothetical protein